MQGGHHCYVSILTSRARHSRLASKAVLPPTCPWYKGTRLSGFAAAKNSFNLRVIWVYWLNYVWLFLLYKFSPAVRFIFILVQPHPRVPLPAPRFYFPWSRSSLWNTGRVSASTCSAPVGLYQLDSRRYLGGVWGPTCCSSTRCKVVLCLPAIGFLFSLKLFRHNMCLLMLCYFDLVGLRVVVVW